MVLLAISSIKNLFLMENYVMRCENKKFIRELL